MSAVQIDMDSIGRESQELVAYEISEGARVLTVRRIGVGVEVSDHPVDGEGLSYPVDRGFESAEQLAAFAEDYVRQAVVLDAPPMSDLAIATLLASTDVEEFVSRVTEAYEAC